MRGRYARCVVIVSALHRLTAAHQIAALPAHSQMVFGVDEDVQLLRAWADGVFARSDPFVASRVPLTRDLAEGLLLAMAFETGHRGFQSLSSDWKRHQVGDALISLERQLTCR